MKYQIFGSVLLFGSTACQSVEAKPPKQLEKNHVDKLMEGAQVARTWQRKFWQSLIDSDSKEAFALFSTGGWSDDGQAWILCGAEADSSATLVEKGTANAQTPELDKVATCKELVERAKQWRTLTAWDKGVLDSFRYEWIHATKDPEGKWNTHRLYMNHPDETAPQHAKIVKYFRDTFKNTAK